MKRWIFLASALWAVAILPCAAAKKADSDSDVCFNSHTTDWAINVAACTRLIASQAKLPVSYLSNDYNQRGVGYEQMGKFDLAIADFDRSIELDPKFMAPYNNRANTWRAKGNFDRAIVDHEQAIRLDPGNWVLHDSLGITLREKGDLDQSIAEFGKTISLKADAPNPFTERGLAWRAKGDLKNAIADYDAAIRIDSITPKPYVGRGLAYEEEGDKERALADFRTAVSLPTRSVITANKKFVAVNVDEDRYIDIARTRLALLSAPGAPSLFPKTENSTPSDGRRIALVIGNGKYVNANALVNPPNDARAVASALRSVGFEVEEGIDLDRSAMDDHIRKFLLRAIGARLAVLFYAGHGMQVDGHNYLVPIDAGFTAKDAITQSLTDLDTILVGLDDQIRANIVILDACRDNPLMSKSVAENDASRSIAVRSGLAAPSGLSKGATSGAGTLLAFATAPGQLALDGEGDDSPFSTALVRHLGTPGLEVQQMLTRVRTEVVAATKGKQVPWSNSALLGEIYLAGKP